jgi:hypothetical protein
VTGRQGRSKQLLEILKEKRIYWKLKDEALWGTRFGRVVKQTT